MGGTEGMTVQAMVELITNQGFAMALVIIAIYFMYRIITRDKNEAKEREEKLMKHMTDSSEALKSNAEAYIRLCDTLDSYNNIVTSMNSKLDNVITELKVNNSRMETVLNEYARSQE